MDVAALLAERPSEAPSGPNLEYDADFAALEIAATPIPERQAGKDFIPAQDPDWTDVGRKALAVLGRAHDLRALAHLAVAETNRRGILGLADATEVARGYLEQYWDTCHPMLDADDNDDPTARISAVTGFGSDLMEQALRRAVLTDSRAHGRLTLRDIQVAHGEYPARADETALEKGNIRAAFEDTPLPAREALSTAARGALADLRAIERIFGDRTPGYGPTLDTTTRLLGAIVRHVGDYAGVANDPAPAEAQEDAAMDAETPADAGPAAAPRGPSAPGTIANRKDVEATLDRLIAYYRDNEPSSPIPILLKRAKRLVHADFMTILRDLAPGGIDSVSHIGGGAEDG